MVLLSLRILDKHFGSDVRDGLKILKGASVIQGDGVSDRKIFREILPAVIAAGFSPLSVSFGMGEYNHRCVRSDLESALKTSMVGRVDYGYDVPVPESKWDLACDDVAAALEDYRPVMKGSENEFKRSIPGPVSIHLDASPEESRVRPISVEQLKAGDVGDYKVLYDGRLNPLPVWEDTFTDMRERCLTSWRKLDPVVPLSRRIDPRITAMQEEYMKEALTR